MQPQIIPLVLFALIGFFLWVTRDDLEAWKSVFGAGILLLIVVAVFPTLLKGMKLDLLSCVVGYLIGFVFLPEQFYEHEHVFVRSGSGGSR